MLDGAGLFPGNDCPPDLDLSSIPAQTATVGEELTIDLPALGGTLTDVDAGGAPTGDTLRWLADPDTGIDFPEGAILTTAGVLTWTPTAAQIGEHSITIIGIDSGSPALADAETLTVTVSPSVDPIPSLDLNGPDAGEDFAATHVEDGGTVAIVGANLEVADEDSANLQGATIAITNLLDGASESLAVVTDGTSINQDYDDATGTLTLSGADSVANYQQVLRSLTYENTSQNPTTTDRIVEISVSDGANTSPTRTSTVTIEAVNDAPEITAIGDQDVIVGDEFSITVTASDAEEDTLSFALDPDNSPATATIEKTSDTTAVVRWMTNAGDENNTFGFRVLVSDDGSPNLANAEAFDVSVHEVNFSPDLAAIPDQTVTVGTELVVNISASDANTAQTLTFLLDPENAPATATIEKTGDTTATIRWTPEAGNVPGPVSFGVVVSDDGFLPLVDGETFEVAVDAAMAELAFDFNGDEAGESFATVFTGETLDVALVAETATISATPGTVLNSMTVRITNAFDRFDEVLSADTADTSITAVYDDATNVLTLTGPDTVENFSKVLRTLRYTNLSLDPDETTRVIEVVADAAEPSSGIASQSFASFTALSASPVLAAATTAPATITVAIMIGLDTDDDGITDKAEIDFFGTNPNLFDTDGDLLPDGVEIRTPGLQPTVVDDNQGDLDSDTLSNLDEVIRGTRLNSSDSDRDGTSDGQEVAQGSNPTDDSDLGAPPESGLTAALRLTVGDHSGSHSERYNLRVGPIVHQAPEFGVVRTAEYDFQRGQSYPVSITHRGSNLSTPDYDYTAGIASVDGSAIFVADPDGVLGVHNESSFFFAEGKTITVHVPDFDLDILNLNGDDIPEDAEDAVGGSLLLNNDDDDSDGIPDNEDSSVSGEDDLARILLRRILPDVLGSEPGEVTLSFESTHLNVWRDADKSEPVLSGISVFDPTLDHELYVEGLSSGESMIAATFMPGSSRSGLAIIGGSITDSVKFTTAIGNLTAFRPMTGPNSYNPFQKTAVPDDLEEDSERGPVIRLNTDDDNNNGMSDRNESSAVGNENDLIEIAVSTSSSSNSIVYERSSTNLRLWTSHDKQEEIVFPDNGLVSTPLESSRFEGSVYAEWVSSQQGMATFSLVDQTSGGTLDTLEFHTSSSVVIALGGEFQAPADPVLFPGDHGIFDLAIDLYRNEGIDVYMFDEDDVGTLGRGVPLDIIVNAVNSQSASNIAIFGYSHGGGSTYDLADELVNDTDRINEPFSLVFTSYIDAVTNISVTEENRRPPGTEYHLNQYQRNELLSGGPSNADEEFDRSNRGVDHGTIDDDAVVLALLKARLLQRV